MKVGILFGAGMFLATSTMYRIFDGPGDMEKAQYSLLMVVAFIAVGIYSKVSE